MNCFNCELCKTRKNIVFSSGIMRSDLMIIGEAPGADEDESGFPFVGRAGKFLTNLLEKVGLYRDTIYITNVVKCRPPNNRKPTKDEINACSTYLYKQIEDVKPKVIILVGSTAMEFFIKENVTISNARGKIFEYKNRVKLVPIFHPSYLLRKHSEEPDAPRMLTISDLKMVKDLLKNNN